MFQRAGISAQRAEREVPPARGRDRGRGRPARRGDDRDEHGRPRHRHQAGRGRHGVEAVEGQGSRRQRASRSWRTAACTSSAPSATSRGASTGSCAAARAARAIRAPTQFFLSLEDDLMRLFGSERIAKLMDRLGAQEGEVLTHPLITRSIEQAQKRVELQNFQARKRLLEYDDVMNQQREVIYSLRAFALEGGEELKGEALKMIERAIERRVEQSLRGRRFRERVGFRRAAPGSADALPPLRAAARGGRRQRSRERSRRRRRTRAGGGERGVPAKLAIARHVLRRALVARDAARARREVEGSSLRSRSAPQRDPLSVVGAEGSARRVQAGGVHDVRGSHVRPLQHLRRAVPARADRDRAATGARRRRRRLERAQGTSRSGADRPDAPLQRARHSRGRAGRRRRARNAAVAPGEPRATSTSVPIEAPKPQRAARKDARIVGAGRGRTISPQAGGQHGLVERRTQRSVSVRLGKEVQEVPRRRRSRREPSWRALSPAIEWNQCLSARSAPLSRARGRFRAASASRGASPVSRSAGPSLRRSVKYQRASPVRAPARATA